MIPRIVSRAAARARHPLPPALLIASLITACGGDSGSGPGLAKVTTVQVADGSGQSAAVGELLRDSLTVRVLDQSQRPLDGIPVTWAVETGGGTVTASSRTGASGTARAGWRMGTVAGAASVRATAGGISTSFAATVNPGPVAAVMVTPATFTIDAGAQRQVQGGAQDSYGNAISGRSYTWTTSDAAIATVDGNGNVRGMAGGTATIRGTTGGINGSATVTVNGPPATPPTIAAISPALLEPGVTATITGTNFWVGPGGTNVVSINNVNATVSSATATELRVVVPALGALGCLPSGTVNIAVTVGTQTARRPHPLRTAAPRSLSVGEVVTAADAAAFGCTELSANSGRYLVSVYNGASPAAVGGFVPAGPGIRMTAAGPPAASAAAAASVLSPGAQRLSRDVSDRLTRAARFARGHREHLSARQRQFAGVRAPSLAAAQASEPSAALRAAALGDTVWIRYPDPAQTNACATFDSLRARVAHISPRSIILEDLAVPLPGQIDSLYPRIAQTFDNEQYAVVRDNFGDPLAMDAQLNNDGKLYMLFTRRVNNYGAAGFVWPGDILPRSSCAQSNLAEIFYGMVPTVQVVGSEADMSIADWYWYTRSTVVHEVKHIASTVARLSRSGSPAGDEVWLEEATAMVAEEIWARGLFGHTQRGNVGFTSSLLCEFGVGTGCADKPLVMLNHIGFLYDYLAGTETLSVLGPTAASDNSFYGSSWSFLRWALDQSTTAEGALLRALTQTAASGVTNLSTVIGRPYPEMIREFSVAMAADDQPGLTVADAHHSMPSWNLRDLFRGLNEVLPEMFPATYPLTTRTLGTSPINLTQIRPGGAAYFELVVPETGARAFQVLPPTGGTLSPDVRVALLRIQ